MPSCQVKFSLLEPTSTVCRFWIRFYLFNALSFRFCGNFKMTPSQDCSIVCQSESQEDNQSPISSEPFTDLSLSQTHKEEEAGPHKSTLFSKTTFNCHQWRP